MSPAHILEPTYNSLKRRLMAGAWPIGGRLEAMRLADDLGVSMTPVRDSLNQLVGERLVDFRPGEGFRVARISEGSLRDLFEFNLTLLDIALRSPHRDGLLVGERLKAPNYPDRVAAIFEGIAARSANTILGQAVLALNERLHATRALDPRLFPDATDEVADIARQAEMGSAVLRASLTSYHYRRSEVAGQFVRLLEQSQS